MTSGVGRDEYGAGRRANATYTLHTTVVRTAIVRECRVCRGPIEIDEPMRARAHALEYSHVTCGWLRADEHDVHEVSRPGTSFVFYEWRCVVCGLDACRPRRPVQSMACIRCAPDRDAVMAGKRVAALSGMWCLVNRRRRTFRSGEEVGRCDDVTFNGFARVVTAFGKAVIPVDALIVV